MTEKEMCQAMDIDLSAVQRELEPFLGSDATIAQCVRELVERSLLLAEWQGECDRIGVDFEDLILAQQDDRPNWEQIGIQLWRDGVITCNEFDHAELIVARIIAP